MVHDVSRLLILGPCLVEAGDLDDYRHFSTQTRKGLHVPGSSCRGINEHQHSQNRCLRMRQRDWSASIQHLESVWFVYLQHLLLCLPVVAILGNTRKILHGLLKCPHREDVRYGVASLICRTIDGIRWARCPFIVAFKSSQRPAHSQRRRNLRNGGITLQTMEEHI